MWKSTNVVYARIIIEFTVTVVLFVQIWILNLVLTRNRGKPRRRHPHRRRTFPLAALPSLRCPLAIGQNRNSLGTWDVRACALAFSSPSPLHNFGHQHRHLLHSLSGRCLSRFVIVSAVVVCVVHVQCKWCRERDFCQPRIKIYWFRWVCFNIFCISRVYRLYVFFFNRYP